MIRRLVLLSIFLIAAALFNCSKDLSVDSGSEPILAANEISISYYNYSLPSIPAPLLENENYVQGELIWYNPYFQYMKYDIWPNEKFSSDYAQTTPILRLKMSPDTSANSPEKRWAGVMQFLNKEDSLFSERKNVDILLQYGTYFFKLDGRLHIEFGAFSEDVFPNGKLDTEDRNGNHRLDSGENVGLDGMANDDARAISAGGDFWDVNGNGVKDEGEKYSNDDWFYDPYQLGSDGIDYSSVNGTEGNQHSNAAGIIPDTEDLNQNGVLDLDNNYYTFELHLSHEHEHYAKFVTYEGIDTQTGMDFGWRLYSIPLDDYKEIGSPSWDYIESMRLWVDGYDGKTVLAIASIEINEKTEEN
jgi:cell surface protein SprA